MSNEKLAEALRDLENRIIQRLAWLREGSLIDIQAFTADIEAMLLHLRAAESARASAMADFYQKLSERDGAKVDDKDEKSLHDIQARAWAEGEGFHSFRETKIEDGVIPDFTKAVNA